LTKYVHVQSKLDPDQVTKQAICKACKSKEQIFENGKNEDKDQEVMMYEDPDESMAPSTISESMLTDHTSEISSSSHINETRKFKTKKNTTLDTYINGLFLRFVKCSTLCKVVDFFNLTVKIPSNKLLSSKVLIEHAEKLEQSKISKLSESQKPIIIIFDGWKNVHCQEILDAVILSATNQLHIWGAEDVSNSRQRTPNVLNIIITFLACASSQNLNVVAIVIDSASAYAFACNRFWTHIDELVEHFLPFVNILDYLQHDAANLFDVAYAFGYVAQQYKSDIDGFGYQMQQKLERRWADWEQPLLFLAIIFHLQYRVQALFDANFFSLERISKWIEYYYEMWFGQYWEFVAIDQKEIGKVAHRLYSIKVNSAPYEHLFSQIGWFQNPKHNRLK
ncbi:14190_t:CDS:2, partial [Cetraspora pellucida]